MEEKGSIVKKTGEYAFVKVDKRAECKKCGLCAFPKNVDSVELRAYNKIDANVGDEVIVSTNEKGKWLSLILVFGVPLLIIGGVFALAFFSGWSEVMMPLIGVGAIIIWFIILGVADKKFKMLNAFRTEITGLAVAVSKPENVEPIKQSDAQTPLHTDDSDNKGDKNGNN